MAMLNLDMIGRVQNGHIFVSGAQTGSTFAKISGGSEAAAAAVDR